LTAIDGESIQYTQYGAGQFYDWHIDAAIDETARQEIRDKYVDMQVAIDAAASADELKTILGFE